MASSRTCYETPKKFVDKNNSVVTRYLNQIWGIKMVIFMIMEILISNQIQCHKKMTDSQRTAMYGSHFSSFGMKRN